MKHR
jgi:hypothetical protein